MGTLLSVIGTVTGKILLFLLFCILFFVVLAGCILWIPVRYRFRGSYGEEKVLQGKASWFLGVFQAKLRYEEDWHITVKLFGMDLIAFLEKRAKKKKAKETKKRKKTAHQTEKKEAAKEERISKDSELQGELFVAEQSEADQSEIGTKVAKENQEDTLLQETQTKEERSRTKKSFGKDYKKGKEKRIKRFFVIKKIKKWFRSIKSFAVAIRKRIRQASWLKELWKDDNTQALVCILKDNVVHLWRKLKPKKLEANVCFGTGQPDTTGKILALLAVFYACYGSNVSIIPDFEQARLEGWIRMKGHISVFTVLVILIKIFMSKEWSQFRKDTMQWKEAF